MRSSAKDETSLSVATFLPSSGIFKLLTIISRRCYQSTKARTVVKARGIEACRH
jgi:hypothetical protein